MKRVAVLLLLLAACREEPRLANVPTDNTVGTLPPDTTMQELTTTIALVPADSQTPAAGACALAHDGYAVIELKPDVPQPRCTIVHSLDRLRFHNATTEVVTIDVGFARQEMQPDELLTLGEQLGDVWQPGVHHVQASLYSVDVWLK